MGEEPGRTPGTARKEAGEHPSPAMGLPTKQVTIEVQDAKIVRTNHHDAVVSVRNKDQIEWVCRTHDFEVNGFHEQGCSASGCGHAGEPFAGTRYGRRRNQPGLQPLSGVANAHAVNHSYKSTWNIYDPEGNLLDFWDPHIRVDP